MFFFDKRSADKLTKPRRRETVSEVLRLSIRHLDRLRHPKLLQIVHGLEESSDTLAFASEPLIASLANVIGTLEDRLPQQLPNHVRGYTFLDFEIKYGLLQVSLPISQFILSINN